MSAKRGSLIGVLVMFALLGLVVYALVFELRARRKQAALDLAIKEFKVKTKGEVDELAGQPPNSTEARGYVTDEFIFHSGIPGKTYKYYVLYSSTEADDEGNLLPPEERNIQFSFLNTPNPHLTQPPPVIEERDAPPGGEIPPEGDGETDELEDTRQP